MLPQEIRDELEARKGRNPYFIEYFARKADGAPCDAEGNAGGDRAAGAGGGWLGSWGRNAGGAVPTEETQEAGGGDEGGVRTCKPAPTFYQDAEKILRTARADEAMWPELRELGRRWFDGDRAGR